MYSKKKGEFVLVVIVIFLLVLGSLYFLEGGISGAIVGIQPLENLSVSLNDSVVEIPFLENVSEEFIENTSNESVVDMINDSLNFGFTDNLLENSSFEENLVSDLNISINDSADNNSVETMDLGIQATCGGAQSCSCGDYLNESYTLSGDLSCSTNGLYINASNIVLDCQGNFINGNQIDSDFGIKIQPSVNNITIKNCEIYDFLNSGIYISDSTNHNIFNNTIHNNEYGITTSSVENSSFYDNNLTDNNRAFSLTLGSQNNFTNNTIKNGIFGFWFGSVYAYNFIDNLIEGTSGASGAAVYGVGIASYFANNTIINNGNYGFNLITSGQTNFTFQNNNFTNNSLDGIYIDGTFGDYNLYVNLIDNYFSKNGYYAFHTYKNGGNAHFDVNASNNQFYDNGMGIYLHGAVNSDFVNNTFNNNSNLLLQTAFYVDSSHDSLFERNSFTDEYSAIGFTEYFPPNLGIYNNKIINNTFLNSAKGVTSVEVGNAVNNLNISYNNFTNLTVHSISLWTEKSASVYQNNIHESLIGVQYYLNSSNGFVYNNTITNTSIGVDLNSNSSNNLIYNNIIRDYDDIAARGIYVHVTSNNNTFYNNIINEMWKYSFDIDSTSANNLIYNNIFNATLSNSYFNDANGSNSWNTSKTLGTNIIGGPYLGGNFYYDYTGSDINQDGLGEEPYLITGAVYDYLPLNNVGLGCGSTLTSSVNLTQNLSSSGTCFTIGADNIVLDCVNYSITGSNLGSAVYSNGYNNVTIKNCLIDAFDYGVHLTNSDNFSISNSILKNNDFHGLQLLSSSDNTNLTNLTLKDNRNHGLYVYASNNELLTESYLYNNTYHGINTNNANNTQVRNNQIYENGWSGIGMDLTYNLTVENNTFYDNNNRALHLATGGNNLFLNNNLSSTGNSIFDSSGISTYNQLIYNNTYGQIFWNLTDLSTVNDLNIETNLYLENNNVGLADLAGLSNLNSSAKIEIRQLSYSQTPVLLKNGIRCDNSNFCNISYTANTLYANVSSFSNYTTASGCGTLTESLDLLYDLTTSSNCFIIGADDLVLDCQGHNITGSNSGVGIYVNAHNNVTVKNCILSNFDYGINYESSSDNGMILNNTLFDNILGIYVFSSNNETIINNTLHDNNPTGISFSTSNENLVQENDFYGNGYYGLNLASGANNNLILNNNFTNHSLYSIYDHSGISYYNQLIYNNSYGEINWNKTDLDVVEDINEGTNLYLENNNVGLGTFTGSSDLNSSAEIEIRQLSYSQTPQLFKDGVRCDNSNLCNISYTANTLYANVSSFSNYTTYDVECGTITESTTLLHNLSNSGTCFTIGANDIILDCAGYAITVTRSDYGVYVFDHDNVTIQNCFIQGAGDGIFYNAGSDNGLVLNNTLYNNSRGVFFSQILNTSILNNTFYNNSDKALEVINSENSLIKDNLIYDNNIGISLVDNSQNNILLNNNITNTFLYTISDTSASLYYNQLIYNNTYGQIYWNQSDLDLVEAINVGTNLYLENNLVGLASLGALTKLNTSAEIEIRQLSYAQTPILLKDGIRCDNSNLCNISYIADTLYANVSSFSNYTTYDVNCGTITEDTTLTRNVSSSGTCFTIGANNITLDCAGYTITGDTSLGETGVYVPSFDNVIVKNCLINNYTYGIYYYDADVGTILNNTIYNTNRGIYFSYSDNASVLNNTVYQNNLTGRSGIQTFYSDNNLISENVLYDNYYGIFLSTGTDNNLLLNNNISNSNLNTIYDQSTGYNQLVYNNTYGEIFWNKTTLKVVDDINEGNNLYLENNNVGLGTFTGESTINSSAEIEIKGISYAASDVVLLWKDNLRCRSPNCDYSYDSGTQVLSANVSSFSNYTSTVDNQAPVFSNPINTSLNFGYGQNFTANITVIDNGTLSTYNYSTNASGSWININLPLSGYTFNLSNTSLIAVTKGNEVCWYYWANDTADNSVTSDTYCFVVQNTAPTAPTVDLTPNLPDTNSDLICNITSNSTDVDGDNLNYTFNWYKDGVLDFTFGPTLETIHNLTSGNTSNGEIWVCNVTAFDGTDTGIAGTDVVSIGNTAPYLTDVQINSNDFLSRANGSLTGNYTYHDYDSDPETLNETKWYNNSVAVTELSNFTLVSAGNLSKHQNWTFSVRVYDGALWSAWENSSLLTIQNNPPMFDEDINTSIYSIGTESDFNLDVNCSDLVDTDTVTYYDNTTLFEINLTTGLINDTPAENEKGTYSINLTCSDGEVNVSQILSYQINDTTAPTFTDALNTSLNFKYGDNLTANITFNDGDELAESYLFYHNASGGNFTLLNDNGKMQSGVSIYNASELFIINLTRGKEICWLYNVADVSGNSANSSTYCFTVNNSIPTFDVDTMDSPYALQEYNYYITCSDNDNDPINYYDDDPYFDINLTTGLINYTPTESEVGVHLVGINCSDGIDQNFRYYGYYVYDTAAPRLTIDSPTTTTYTTNTSLDLNYTITEYSNTTCWYNLDAGTNYTLTDCTNITFDTSSGTHTLYLYANDSYNNLGSANVTFTANLPPTITALTLSPDPAYTNSDLQANVTFNDDGVSSGLIYFNWTRDDLQVAYNTYSVVDGETITDTLASTYFNKSQNITVYVFGSDSLSNTSLSSLSLNISNSLPTFDQSLTSQKINFTQTFIYDLNCSDLDTGIDTVTYYDNTSLFNIDSSTGLINHTPLENEFGNYSIEIICGDGIGNTSETFSYFIADSTAPRLTIESPTATTYTTNLSLDLNYTVNESNLDSCWYNLDLGANNTLTSCANITFNTSSGAQTLYLYANDSSGNLGFADVSFIVDQLSTIGTLTLLPNPAYTNDTLNATVLFTGDSVSSEYVYFNWTRDDVQIDFNVVSATNGNVSNTLASTYFNKSQNITVYVFGGDGLSNTSLLSTSINISNSLPTQIQTFSAASTTPNTNLTYNLSEYFSDHDGDEINYTYVNLTSLDNITLTLNNTNKIATIISTIATSLQTYFIANDSFGTTDGNSFTINFATSSSSSSSSGGGGDRCRNVICTSVEDARYCRGSSLIIQYNTSTCNSNNGQCEFSGTKNVAEECPYGCLDGACLPFVSEGSSSPPSESSSETGQSCPPDTELIAGKCVPKQIEYIDSLTLEELFGDNYLITVFPNKIVPPGGISCIVPTGNAIPHLKKENLEKIKSSLENNKDYELIWEREGYYLRLILLFKGHEQETESCTTLNVNYLNFQNNFWEEKNIFGREKSLVTEEFCFPLRSKPVMITQEFLICDTLNNLFDINNVKVELNTEFS